MLTVWNLRRTRGACGIGRGEDVAVLTQQAISVGETVEAV